MRRVALVTGASRGIGAACASEFARRGWAVVMVARSTDRLASVADPLGAAAVRVVGDVAEPDVSRAAVAAALESFGRLDAVVANAGITLAKPIEETTGAELDRMLAVNVKAIVHVAQAAHLPLARTRGAFLVMASNKGLVAQEARPSTWPPRVRPCSSPERWRSTGLRRESA